MWSVGISASPSEDALRLGYDDRQINRIVIRMARYFLNKDMQVIFGHDWRNNGVMQAIADYAEKTAAQSENMIVRNPRHRSQALNREVHARMLNVVTSTRESINSTALKAERQSGGVLKVIPVHELLPTLRKEFCTTQHIVEKNTTHRKSTELTELRHCLTVLLNPGCRVCLGGITDGFQGREPGVIEEAKLALEYQKPLYLMGGFGGATRDFGVQQRRALNSYWKSHNGLDVKQKQNLFETTDVERAIRLIANGIDLSQNLSH